MLVCDAQKRWFWVALLTGLLSLVSVQGLAFDIDPGDGGIGQWPRDLASTTNTGRIVRDGLGQGAYLWHDHGDDHLSVVVDADDVNILSFSVTGSPSGLGLLLESALPPSGASPAQYQIAIDLDRVSGSGQLAFVGSSETQVAALAQWEYLVQTQYGSGGAPLLWDSLGAQTTLNAELVLQSTAFTEIFVPWSALGLTGPPSSPLRFTVASFTADASNAIMDLADKPNALDVVTDYGEPKRSVKTSSEFFEVGDVSVDYYFDVDFGVDGEVYPPALVFAYRPDPASGYSEWIAIRNQREVPLDLTGFRVGDEEQPQGGEGMVAFPSGLGQLAPGEVVMVAVEGDLYQQEYGVLPFAELNGESGAPVMDDLAIWGSSNISLNNMGDQVMVLDPSNTILDLVTYGSGADSNYPGVVPVQALASMGLRCAMP